MLLNVGFYVGVSLFTRQSDAEVRQAIVFVDSYSPAQFAPSQRPLTVPEIEDILGQYLGHGEAREAIDGFLTEEPAGPGVGVRRMAAEAAAGGRAAALGRARAVASARWYSRSGPSFPTRTPSGSRTRSARYREA